MDQLIHHLNGAATEMRKAIFHLHGRSYDAERLEAFLEVHMTVYDEIRTLVSLHTVPQPNLGVECVEVSTAEITTLRAIKERRHSNDSRRGRPPPEVESLARKGLIFDDGGVGAEMCDWTITPEA